MEEKADAARRASGERLCPFSFRDGERGALLDRALGRRLQFGRLQALGRLPQALEFVIPPGLLGEDMNDEIDVVEQDPLGLAIAFDVSGVESGLLQAEFDFFSDGLDLARIGAAAYDEVVGKGSRTLVQFEDGDFFGLLVLTGGDGFGYLALGVVGLHAVLGRWSLIVSLFGIVTECRDV